MLPCSPQLPTQPAPQPGRPAGHTEPSPRSRETGSREQLADLGESLAFPLSSCVTALKPPRLPFLFWWMAAVPRAMHYLRQGVGMGALRMDAKGNVVTSRQDLAWEPEPARRNAWFGPAVLLQ